jgi:hypothetical protein
MKELGPPPCAMLLWVEMMPVRSCPRDTLELAVFAFLGICIRL